MNFRTKNKEQRTKFAAGILLCSLFFVPCSVFAGEPLYTLSAKVSESRSEDSSFKARFQHPATGENLEYLFKVTEHTGMNGMKKVSELKPNDILQIDYFKTEDGSLVVEYMARVKMKGAPDGLESFNPADLLKKN